MAHLYAAYRSSYAGANGVPRWAAGAKWAAGAAPDDQRDMPLVLSLSEGLGVNAETLMPDYRESLGSMFFAHARRL